MPLLNSERGYGAITKSLHWLTVLALVGQFTVGYLMEVDDGSGRGRGRGRGGDSEGSGRGRGRGGDEGDYDVLNGSWDLLDLHVALGLLVLALALTRTVWRLTTPLPPWDPRLSATDRRLVHATEVALLALLYVVPASGLVLVLSGEDDVLPVHVAAHVAFFVVLAAHLGMVLGRRLLPRMLPGTVGGRSSGSVRIP